MLCRSFSFLAWLWLLARSPLKKPLKLLRPKKWLLLLKRPPKLLRLLTPLLLLLTPLLRPLTPLLRLLTLPLLRLLTLLRPSKPQLA